MMAKQGFILNKATVAAALLVEGEDARHAAAEDVLANALTRDPRAFITHYVTDRAVTAVVVDAAAQAKRGAGTAAANEAKRSRSNG